MKKTTLIASLIFATTLNAQTEPTNLPTAKGNWIIGGSTNLGFSSNKSTSKTDNYSADGQKITNFNITPSVGYFVMDNLAVGINLGYEVQKYDSYQNAQNSTFSVIPSLTYFIEADSKAFPYVSAGAGYAFFNTKSDTNPGDKTNFFAWGAKAGLAYFITPSIAIDLGLTYQQLSTKYNAHDGIPESKEIYKNLGAAIGFNFVL